MVTLMSPQKRTLSARVCFTNARVRLFVRPVRFFVVDHPLSGSIIAVVPPVNFALSPHAMGLDTVSLFL